MSSELMFRHDVQDSSQPSGTAIYMSHSGRFSSDADIVRLTNARIIIIIIRIPSFLALFLSGTHSVVILLIVHP